MPGVEFVLGLSRRASRGPGPHARIIPQREPARLIDACRVFGSVP